MATVTLNRASTVGGSDVPGLTHEKAVTVTGSSWTKVQESLDIGTDVLINLAIDVSTVKLFRIYSTTAATVETNSSSAPDDTLALAAGRCYDFVTGDPTPLLLTADVTAIYVTNAAATVLTIELLQDATP
jgi:hypothetical protein